MGARGLSPTGLGSGAVRKGQGLTPAHLGGPTVRLSRPGGWSGAWVKAGVPDPWGAGCHPCLTPQCPHPRAQGPVCVSARLRLAERRLQRLQEVQAKRELLRGELAETQGRLMLEPGRWLEQCESPSPAQHPGSATSPQPQGAGGRPGGWEGEGRRLGPGDPGLNGSPRPPTPAVEVDPGLEPESAEYLAALERATAALEQCVNLCKAHVMMVTCFDISAAAPAAAPGPQEVDV